MATYCIKLLKVHVDVYKSHLAYITCIVYQSAFSDAVILYLTLIPLTVSRNLTQFWSHVTYVKYLLRQSQAQNIFSPRVIALGSSGWRWMRKKGRKTWDEFSCTSPQLSAIIPNTPNPFTGWHITLEQTSRWHEKKSYFIFNVLLILKHNFCFHVKRRFESTWCITL